MRCILALCLTLFVSTMGAGCATTDDASQGEPAVDRELDKSVGIEIAKTFELDLKFKKSQSVQDYLSKMTAKLIASEEAFSKDEAEVFVIHSSRAKTGWRNFGLPNAKIYLSNDLLKRIEFENELAAVIAFELGHIKSRHLLNHIENQNRKTANKSIKSKSDETVSVSPAGISFTNRENRQALYEAVRLLYRSGYDPRGLVSVWNLHLRNQKRSPYVKRDLNRFVDWSHEFIVQYTPLRNPIVRSDEFVEIRPALGKL